MPDYKNGKIYQLVCNETGEVYIGSTVQDLERRLSSHEVSANCCRSKQIIDRNNYYIEILETYPCNNEFELDRKEGEYQRAIECINYKIAGRTAKEYYQDNKEKLVSSQHEYRQNNKEAINAINKAYNSKVVICECGIKSTKGSLSRHRRSKRHIDLINLETIKPPVGEVVVCECGSSCVKQQLARHRRTKRHIDLMNKLNLS